MASISHKFIMNNNSDYDEKNKSSESKKAALRYSIMSNLDPLLELEESIFEEIPVLHIKEGKA